MVYFGGKQLKTSFFAPNSKQRSCKNSVTGGSVTAGEQCSKNFLQISGEISCNQDQECEKDEQCSDGNCVSACALLSCRHNLNCIAENHKVKCECHEGYSLDVGTNECQRGRRIQCSNFHSCTGSQTKIKQPTPTYPYQFSIKRNKNHL